MTALATSPARTSIRRRGTAQTHAPGAVDEGVDRVLGAATPASRRRPRRPAPRRRARLRRATTATPCAGAPEPRLHDERERPRRRVGPRPRRAAPGGRSGSRGRVSHSWVATLSAAIATTSGDETATVVADCGQLVARRRRAPAARVDRRHDEVDAAARRTARPSAATNVGSSHAGTSKRGVGAVPARSSTTTGRSASDPPVEAEVVEGGAEAPQQLDAPAGRRDQNGAPSVVMSATGRELGHRGVTGAGDRRCGASTTGIVAARIRRSRASERCSTYHTSSSRRSSHGESRCAR